MSEIKYLEIDSFNQDDTDALFVALCKKACDIDPNEAKITVSAEGLDIKSVVGYKATLTDLLSLIGMYDIPFKFKTEFLSREVGASASIEKKNLPAHDSNKVCDVYKEMAKQSNDIKNPDLVEAPDFIDTHNPQISPSNFESSIDPNSIPDFKM
jgi:hypothetical protein